MNQERSNVPVSPVPNETRYRSADSIPDLIRNLATDLSSLLGKEIALAKSELRESASEVKTSIASLAMGGAIAMAGVVILLLSAVYGLSNIVDPWLAALIVGLGALLVGYMMVRAAKEKMSASSLVPGRTVDSMKKDKDTLMRAAQ